MKTVHVVYFSATGTTGKVVHKVAEGTGLTIQETDFTKLKNGPKPPSFGADELVIVGIPVYFGRVPSFLVNYVKGLRGDQTPCAAVVVYGNRHFDDSLVELTDLLTEGGFKVIAGAAFIGEHSFSSTLGGGRPNDADTALAFEFGQSVRAKLDADAAALAADAIPGERPYREYPAPTGQPFGPSVGEGCDRCGGCAERCPTGAIDPADVTNIDFTKCLRCRACAKGCEKGAIDIRVGPFVERVKGLEQTYAEYKEVVIVL